MLRLAMIWARWMPVAIFGAIALAHRPASPASAVPATASPVQTETPLEAAHGEVDPSTGVGCDIAESGTPVKVSPYACRTPRQSPNLDPPPLPEWWAKVTLPDLPIERPWEVSAAVSKIIDNPKRKLLIRAALERSGAFAPNIVSELAIRKLPKSLIALPILESAYSTTAVSKAGATGLWQLMPGTARKLGLTVMAGYDERRNPERATAVALDHLAELYDHFGNWDLALAAYDRGAPGVDRALNRAGVPDYWSLVDMHALPQETREYVASLLAVAIIYENAALFSLDGPRAPPRSIAVLEVPIDTPLALIARAAGTSLLGLRRASPELVFGDTVPTDHVCIPASGLSRARVMLPMLLAQQAESEAISPDFDWGRDDSEQPEKKPKKSKNAAPHIPDDYVFVPETHGVEPAASADAPVAAKPQAHKKTVHPKTNHQRSLHGKH